MKDFKYDDIEHVYTLSGKRMYGTTTILRVIAKPALINWAVKVDTDYITDWSYTQEALDSNPVKLREVIAVAKKQHTKKKDDAGDWGSIVHKAIESWIKTQEIPKEVVVKDVVVKVLPEHLEAIDNFVKWAKENKAIFIQSELPIYSEEWFTGGTVDFVCKIGDELVIGDVKTSSGIWDEYWLQVSAYAKMMMEMGIHSKFDKMTIVNCKKDGTIKVESRTDIDKNIDAFASALTLYKHLNK